MVRSENDIWRVIFALVGEGIAESFPEVKVRRVYQQSAQSIGEDPQVTLFRLGSHKVGSLGKSQKWNEDRESMIQTETWRQELTIQAGAIVAQSAAEDAVTAADILEMLTVWLHGDIALEALRKAGIGILAITDLREIPFRDDREQYSINTNFDFTLTYTQSRERAIPVATSIERKVYRI